MSLRRTDHASRGVLPTVMRVVCDLETSRMRRPWPALGHSATKEKEGLVTKNIHWSRLYQWDWWPSDYLLLLLLRQNVGVAELKIFTT